MRVTEEQRQWARRETRRRRFRGLRWWLFLPVVAVGTWLGPQWTKPLMLFYAAEQHYVVTADKLAQTHWLMLCIGLMTGVGAAMVIQGFVLIYRSRAYYLRLLDRRPVVLLGLMTAFVATVAAATVLPLT